MEYLLKPLDLHELQACLERMRQRQQVAEAAHEEAIPLATALEVSKIQNPYAAEMLRFIQEHYAERISLTDLSQALNLSCTHLNAKFKAETGYTFHDFLNYYRISRAVELQQQGGYRLYEIAEMVGFVDYKYFNKVYKRYVGYAPNKIFPGRK